jgi:hypothetical protein
MYRTRNALAFLVALLGFLEVFFVTFEGLKNDLVDFLQELAMHGERFDEWVLHFQFADREREVKKSNWCGGYIEARFAELVFQVGEYLAQVLVGAATSAEGLLLDAREMYGSEAFSWVTEIHGWEAAGV